MPLGDFVEPGTTPRPLPIGRTARLALGIWARAVFVGYIFLYDKLVGSDFPVSGYWIGVVFAWWFFPDLVVVGFGLQWGRWPQIAVVPVAIALAAVDFVAIGTIWGPRLSLGVFLFTEFFFGAIAVSLLLAGLLAVPG